MCVEDSCMRTSDDCVVDNEENERLCLSDMLKVYVYIVVPLLRHTY